MCHILWFINLLSLASFNYTLPFPCGVWWHCPYVADEKTEAQRSSVAHVEVLRQRGVHDKLAREVSVEDG